MTTINAEKDVYTVIAKSLYDSGEEGYLNAYDYDKIINLFGDVVARVDTEDCRGDTLAIVKKNGRYGFVAFSWGSCSGCDALQACDTYEELGQLIQSIEKDVVWRDSAEDMKSYVNNDDRTLSHYAHMEFWGDFKSQVNALT